MAATQKSHSNPDVNRRRVTPDADLPARSAEAKTQLGARISEANHRQLKVAAALCGIKVQDLVDQAIQEFFTNHPELLQNSPVASQPAKSTPRRPR